MNTISIKKETLIEKLTENRALHIKEYNELMEAYQIAAVKATEQLLEKVKAGAKGVSLRILIDEPQSSEDSYTNALEMLEYESDVFCTISQKEFKQFIKDEWNFSHSFAMSKAAYFSQD